MSRLINNGSLYLIYISLFFIYFNNNTYASPLPMKSAYAILEDQLTTDEHGGLYLENGDIHIVPIESSRSKILKLKQEIMKMYSNSSLDVNIIIDNNAHYTYRQLTEGYEKIKWLDYEKYGLPFMDVKIDIKNNTLLVKVKNSLDCVELSSNKNWKENLITQLEKITNIKDIVFEVRSIAIPVYKETPALIFTINSNEIKRYVYKNNQLIYLNTIITENSPCMKNNKIMLPLEDLIKAYDVNAQFIWDEKKQEWNYSFYSSEGIRTLHLDVHKKIIKFGVVGETSPNSIELIDNKIFIAYNYLYLIENDVYYDINKHQVCIGFNITDSIP